jgi:predicted O-linked N-acetylglucosamine transferase (SPINDLY family)
MSHENNQLNILQQALAHHRSGRLPQAEALYRQILLTEPDHPEALHYLGLLAHQVGRNEIAVELISKALTYRPDDVNAHQNLGIALMEQGKLDEAVVSFRRVLTLRPDFTDAHNNLGAILKDQGKLDEAAASFRQALSLKPDFAMAHYNLGNVLMAQGKLDEAVASFRQAVTLKPDYIAVHYNLGQTLTALEKLDEAAASYRRALTLKPDFAEAHNNLGMVSDELGKLDEAVANYRQALTLKPDYVEAHNNMGNVLMAQGKLDEAVASYRRALFLKPDFTLAFSNLLMCLNYVPNQSISLYLDEARNYGRIASSKVSVGYSDWTCSKEPERLNIGMVSGDFCNHPVGYFLENLLANIDTTKIDLVAYPTHRKEDELTDRIRSHFVAWKPLVGLHDEACAHLIRDDGVHVLLDLSGHTRHNRLPVFAWKPAPVQASWLGYFASTGMAAMDYLIADLISVPESHQVHFTEKIWYLPETRLCFSPPASSEKLAPTPLPALRNGHITFGCFQHLSKLSENVLAAWGRIFQALPQARLRLQHRLLDSPSMRRQLQQRLTRNGIGPERIAFKRSVPRLEYLAAHAHIDIILDTFPFTGGTTTCEALWMGVPSVTLAGNTMVSRQGASLLTCVGLTDWIAANDEDYVAKAIAHAADFDKLARLRAGLRQQVLTSPLFDGPRFAKNFVEAMWGMWQGFRAEQ